MRFILTLFLLVFGFALAKEPLMAQCGESTPSIQVIGLESELLQKPKGAGSCSSSKSQNKVKHKKPQSLIK